MSCKKEPVLLSPAYKDYLWGGERLKLEYNKKTEITPLAETWECSTHPDGESMIISGKYKGKALTQALRENPDWIGTHPKIKDSLPILVKLIDAKKDLSVQVHPNDDYAIEHENQLGKTELWYVLDAEPGARLIYGFKHDMTEEQLREYVKNETLLPHLRNLPVTKGDVFFIQPGTVHALSAGTIVAEIQESSNVTYRLYDYGRRDKDGNLRDLHIDKAAQVLNYKKSAEVRQPMRVMRYKPGHASELIGNCEYFRTERIILNGKCEINADELSFVILVCIEGKGKTENLDIEKGSTVFIPAGTGKVSVSGKCTLLSVRC